MEGVLTVRKKCANMRLFKVFAHLFCRRITTTDECEDVRQAGVAEWYTRLSQKQILERD